MQKLLFLNKIIGQLDLHLSTCKQELTCALVYCFSMFHGELVHRFIKQKHEAKWFMSLNN